MSREHRREEAPAPHLDVDRGRDRLTELEREIGKPDGLAHQTLGAGTDVIHRANDRPQSVTALA